MMAIGWVDSEIVFLIGVSGIIVFGIQSALCFTAERRWVRMLPLVLTPFAFVTGVASLDEWDFILDFWGSCGWGFIIGEFAAWGIYLLAEKMGADR